MNEDLEAITRNLATVLLICSPQFSPGSVGAKAVTIAKNINQVIASTKKKEVSNEKKL